ncbi:hypothetical protein PO124_08030 [Bacillus licheniformis]|nr:hypothetical protein [Bacillus licheniformis]
MLTLTFINKERWRFCEAVLNDDFLLTNETSKVLYHQYAKECRSSTTTAT